MAAASPGCGPAPYRTRKGHPDKKRTPTLRPAEMWTTRKRRNVGVPYLRVSRTSGCRTSGCRTSGCVSRTSGCVPPGVPYLRVRTSPVPPSPYLHPEMWVSRTFPRNVGVPYLPVPSGCPVPSGTFRRTFRAYLPRPKCGCPVPSVPSVPSAPTAVPSVPSCRTFLKCGCPVPRPPVPRPAVPLLPYLCSSRTSGWVSRTSRTSVPLPGVPYLYRTSTSRSTSRTSAVPPPYLRRTSAYLRSAPPKCNVRNIMWVFRTAGRYPELGGCSSRL
jgi:hypothetical protein